MDVILTVVFYRNYPTTGFTQPAMGVLVNLTRDNFSVLSYIKNNVSQFCHTSVSIQ